MKNKIKRHIFLGIIKDIFLILIALLLALAIKEGAHFIAASYYDLEPGFQISNGALGTTAEFSSNEFINRVVNVVGILTNIIVAIVAILILFILQVYLPNKQKTILLYNKKLHGLIEQRYQFLVGGHITFKLFLLIFALANLLLVLFMLLLYPYQGVL